MKRTFLKHILPGLIACLLLATLMCACSQDNKKENIIQDTAEDTEKTSLTFFGFKADAQNLTAIEAAMQGFMDEHPDIDITYEGIKGTDYEETFDKRNEAGELDDITMMHHDRIVTLSEEGKLADLSDLVGLDNFTNEAAGQFTNPDGSVYFLPTQISTYNLYINYDLLEKHGQKIPTDWAEFQKACDYFVSQGITPIIANNRNSLSTLILSKGLFDVYQQDNRGIEKSLDEFNADPALFAKTLEPGVEQVKDMIDRKWFDLKEALATEQTSDDLELFLQGDRPFMISGGWASVRVMAENPTFTYGVYPYPILDDGSVLSLQVDTCISVNAQSPHVKEAKEFVEYLIQPDVMWAYCDSQASYSPLVHEGLEPSEETLNPSREYLTNGRVAFRAEYRLTLPMETAMAETSKALLNGASAAEAQAVLLEELQK